MKFLNHLFILVILFATLSQAKTVYYDDSFRTTDKELSIWLSVDGAELRVRKNDRDDRCYIAVEYDKDECDVDIRFDNDRQELNVNIDHDHSLIDIGDKGDKLSAKIELALPGRPFIDFFANIKAGDLDFLLGDLSIRTFELKSWAGEVSVDFDQPNRIEMENMDVSIKFGEVSLRSLGNSRFKEADINSGIGEMTIDFRGEYYNRSMARIDLDVGETSILLPEEVAIKLKISKFMFLSNINIPSWFEKKGHYYYSQNYLDTERSLYLMISPGIGELDIHIE
jgi:hypothetical protein